MLGCHGRAAGLTVPQMRFAAASSLRAMTTPSHIMAVPTLPDPYPRVRCRANDSTADGPKGSRTLPTAGLASHDRQPVKAKAHLNHRFTAGIRVATAPLRNRTDERAPPVYRCVPSPGRGLLRAAQANQGSYQPRKKMERLCSGQGVVQKRRGLLSGSAGFGLMS